MSEPTNEPRPPKGKGRPVCAMCGYRLSGLVYNDHLNVGCPECGTLQVPMALAPMGRLERYLIWPAALTLLPMLPGLLLVVTGRPPGVLALGVLLACAIGFLGPIISTVIMSDRFARRRNCTALCCVVLFGGWAICGAILIGTAWLRGLVA